MTSTPGATGPPPRRPRVLWLIKGLGLGGAERLLVGLAASRDREAFDVEVAYVLAAQDALAGELRDSGVPVHALGATRTADLRWVPRLRRLLDRGGFDVLHSHLPYTAAFGRLATAGMGRRRRPLLVYTEHSLWNLAAVLTRAANAGTVWMDDALFTVSEASLEALPARLRDRAEVVVHGVDRGRARALLDERPAHRARLRALAGAGDDELVALTVANIRSEKGYDVLLAAVGRCAAAGTKVRFVSVGTGPLAGALAAQARAAGLAERLVFLGQRSDTMELLAGADLFVLPSHQEGLPVALMEAMSVGLPVVATAVGGVPAAVGHDVGGLVVPPGDPEALAGAVAAVAEDDELRARLAEGSAHNGAAFDVAVASRRIEDAYRRLLAARRS